MSIKFGDINRVLDRTLTLSDNDEILEMSFCVLESLHVSIYINGVNTQVLVLRHVRDDIFGIHNDSPFVEHLLKNIDLTYCVPYYRKFFKKLQNAIIPEHLY